MALQNVHRGNTLRDVAERYNISKSTLGKYRNVANIDKIEIDGGRKTKLSKEDENALAKYLYESEKYGYGLTKQEMLIFLKNTVKQMEHFGMSLFLVVNGTKALCEDIRNCLYEKEK